MSSKFIYWKSVLYQTVWDATETVYDNEGNIVVKNVNSNGFGSKNSYEENVFYVAADVRNSIISVCAKK